MGHYHTVKKYFLCYVIVILISFCACSSKKGCIDPGSISYDPDAKIEDGSCTYLAYSLNPLLFRELDNDFSETSGLKYVDNRLWTIVDEAEENKIYSIDLLSGNQKEVLEATGVSAIDFEALSASSTHFFIGDIGNNEGNRTDLTIYKIPKPSTYSLLNTVTYETIKFNYPDQTDFRKNSESRYNAEALMYFNEKLYILTKDHAENTSTLYEIPAHAGEYDATIRGVFDTNGLITDADISPDGKKIVMIGHNKENQKAFLWVIKDFSGSTFFSGKKMLVEIGSVNTIGQVEGVAFHDNNTVFISNEQLGAINQNLYYLDISSVQ